MKKFLKILALVTITLSLPSCVLFEGLSSKKIVEPLDYIEGATKLDIKKFFDGNIEAFGIKQNSVGKIISTSTVKITAKWDENKGTIQQNFFYQDGSKDNRTWLITVNSDGTFGAVGHDVFVPAQGKQIGNAAQSSYGLMVSQKGIKTEVSYEDRMYLVDEKSMIVISKFFTKGSTKEDQDTSGKIIFSLKKIAN